MPAITVAPSAEATQRIRLLRMVVAKSPRDQASTKFDRLSDVGGDSGLAPISALFLKALNRSATSGPIANTASTTRMT